MRSLKLFLMAFGALLAAAAAASAAQMPENLHITLARVIFVAFGAVFLAGCLWRMSHGHRDHGAPGD